MEKKLQKPYPADYDLLKVQDLWQTHYQVLLIILLKEFIKLNVKTNKIIKNVNLLELNTNIATIFFNINTLKMIGYNTNDYVVRKIIKKSLMKS